MEIPRVNIKGIRALGSAAPHAGVPRTGVPRTGAPRTDGPRTGGRPSARTDMFGHWLGKFVFHTTPHRTGIEAQFTIFNQLKMVMPTLFGESMESMLVAGGMYDWEWQALHFMIVRLMTFSQKAKIRMARMDIKDEQELAAKLEEIEMPLADYLLRLKTAHEKDRHNERE
jgi:hypothetical protein